MALWPFILLKRPDLKDNAMLIHHERIHHRQQLELLIVPFYLLYVLHYLFNLCRYRQHDRAYREIVFEREAYACEADATYLHGRKLWAFAQYFGG